MRDEAVPHQDRQGRGVLSVNARGAPTKVSIVERGEIVMHKRCAMQQLDSSRDAS
jgi:hypothetical protein